MTKKIKKPELSKFEIQIREEVKQLLIDDQRITATKRLMVGLEIGLADAYKIVKEIERKIKDDLD